MTASRAQRRAPARRDPGEELRARAAQTRSQWRARFAVTIGRGPGKHKIPAQVPAAGDIAAFILAALGGDAGGACRCAYCAAWLNVYTLRLDHKTPPRRQGGYGIDNLAACCDDCNRTKGELTAREYQALLEGLQTFAEAARRDILKRLKTAGGFLRQRYFQPKPQPSAATEDNF